MTQAIRLPVVPIPGLTPDSLGNYLASLGLLRVLAHEWPQVRHGLAWQCSASSWRASDTQ